MSSTALAVQSFVDQVRELAQQAQNDRALRNRLLQASDDAAAAFVGSSEALFKLLPVLLEEQPLPALSLYWWT